MPLLRDTRERSLNMEFYLVDGWNGIANFQCRSLACGVYGSKYERHATRVTKFDEAQCNNQEHMYKVSFIDDRHMALVGQTRGVVKLWRFSF